MSREEQNQLVNLQEQLTSANRSAEELREHFCSANCEARLYRGLFWCLLAMSSLVAIFRLLER